MTQGRRIIINADDFGLAAVVNEAVAEAHERGVLSSATIMANMPGFEEAARIAKGHPRLGVGVHLNLLRGAPLSDPTGIRTLVDRRGRFPGSAAEVWKRFALRRIDPDELDRELSAQIRRAIDAGILPTHVDSEKHVHALIPALFKRICDVALRFGIRRIRVIREPFEFLRGMPRPGLAQAAKLLLLNRHGFWCARVAMRRGMRAADAFFGVAMTGRMTSEVYRTLFPALPEGTTEAMCHPAASEGAFASIGERSWLDRLGRAEYRALVDPAVREALEESGVSLATYGEL